VWEGSANEVNASSGGGRAGDGTEAEKYDVSIGDYFHVLHFLPALSPRTTRRMRLRCSKTYLQQYSNGARTCRI